MAMIITNIFFDIGQTLVGFDFDRAFDRMSEQSKLSRKEIVDLACEETLIDAYELGQIETAAFFEQIASKYRFTGTADELQAIWCDIFWPLDEHILLARRLAQQYPLALLSNTSDAHIQHLQQTYDFFELFRGKFYSFEVGRMKPDPEFYRHALAEMGGDRFEALFIDDREENVIAASQLGWQTIHVRPDVDLRLALSSYELRGI